MVRGALGVGVGVLARCCNTCSPRASSRLRSSATRARTWPLAPPLLPPLVSVTSYRTLPLPLPLASLLYSLSLSLSCVTHSAGQALAAVCARAESEDLTSWTANVEAAIERPLRDYRHFVEACFGPFSVQIAKVYMHVLRVNSFISVTEHSSGVLLCRCSLRFYETDDRR